MKGLWNQRIILPLVANNMTGTAVIHSLAMNWDTIRGGSIQVIWTGTPVGAFKIEGSLDHQASVDGKDNSSGTWDDLGIALNSPAGAAGSDIADISLTGIPWIRVTYTNASGTGTLTAWGHGKGV